MEDEQEIRAQPRDFRDEREVMTYSWQLFVDKINQKVPLLTEVKNPRIEFNNQKYFEYVYGGENSDDQNSSP